MFFIVNTTKQSISISDLKMVLGPRQGIDLDVKFSREQTERSAGLKSLISKGLISVKNKTEPVLESRFIQEVHNHSHNEIDAEKIKTEIMSGLKEALAEIIPSQQQQPTFNMEDLAKMIASMSPNNQNNVKEKIAKHDEDVKVDEGVLADIHSRTVSKMVENVESADVYGESSTTTNDIDDNIDELEDLLG